MTIVILAFARFSACAYACQWKTNVTLDMSSAVWSISYLTIYNSVHRDYTLQARRHTLSWGQESKNVGVKFSRNWACHTAKRLRLKARYHMHCGGWRKIGLLKTLGSGWQQRWWRWWDMSGGKKYQNWSRELSWRCVSSMHGCVLS